uniref:Rab-GAP TBC domain-containing protein n=2 Tax=Steinernema glaseri TaxID=37863 RepID=A0A1I8AQ14_9BILA
MLVTPKVPSSSLKPSNSNSQFYVPFLDDWNDLFGGAFIDPILLENRSVAGLLKGSQIRSIVWRVLLKCLPCDRSEWEPILERSRKHYVDLKTKLTRNPRDDEAVTNLDVNNPLSLKTESPWMKYFADSKLRESINKDVERTFPEIQFFQLESTKHMMSDILFVYGKHNPHLADRHIDEAYRQGMHEILAPILFVIYCDQEAFADLKDNPSMKNLPADQYRILRLLSDPEYLEADSFALFCEVMLLLQRWYVTNDDSASENPSPSLNELGEVQLFKSIKDTGPSSELIEKLKFIGDVQLQEIDPELWNHLNKLDIAPQIYGIRWLRLLFGREFPMPDLLCLWDAIFADKPTLVLVDFIFIAMLLQIRELLLAGDYSMCLQYLMRYPPTVDVHSFIQLALYLKSPKKFPRPPAGVMTNFSHITLAGKSHPNRAREREDMVVNGFNRHSPESLSISPKKAIKKIDNFWNNIVRNEVKRPPSQVVNSSPRIQPRANDYSRLAHEDIYLLQEQVAILQARVTDMENIGRVASQRITDWMNDLGYLEGTTETKKRLLTDMREVRDHLNRGAINEQLIQPQHTMATRRTSNTSMYSGAVEYGTEAMNAPRQIDAGIYRKLGKENEMIEVGKRKNF